MDGVLNVGVDQLVQRDLLPGYHHLSAARADLLRRLGQRGEARQAYERALGLAQQEPERRFLQMRLAQL